MLWNSDLSSIRVKHFTNSDIRFSYPLPPGEPRHYRWSPAAPEDSEDTLRCSLETLCLSLLQFPTTDISLWITTYTCHSYNHSLLLLLFKDALKYSPLPRESPELTALQFFTTWLPIRIIPCTYRVSVHPQLFVCFIRFYEILFDLPRILFKLLLGNYLSAYIMDASHMSSNIH